MCTLLKIRSLSVQKLNNFCAKRPKVNNILWAQKKVNLLYVNFTYIVIKAIAT